MAVWLSSHEILCSCWLMVRYSLALCAGPFRSGSTVMLLWKTFAYGLNKFPTSQLLSGAFPIHCIEARPGSATLESTELFLFSPYIGGIFFNLEKSFSLPVSSKIFFSLWQNFSSLWGSRLLWTKARKYCGKSVFCLEHMHVRNNICRYLSSINECWSPPKDIYRSIHSSNIINRLKLETTQISSNDKTDGNIEWNIIQQWE